jgi:hypothetical protein
VAGERAHTPRLRQVVLAADKLDAVSARLLEEVRLGEPFHDPAVGYFGLHNAVFALGDTFLEVVSPTRPETAVGRLLQRRGRDCGYMVMFAVDQLDAARERARRKRIREVFEVEFEDIAEVHLHPADMRGAIVALSRPQPPGSWRWGGPDWDQRSVPLRVAGATIGVADPVSVERRWQSVLGAPPASAGVRFVSDSADRGLLEIAIAAAGERREALSIGGVRIVFQDTKEEA